jgi:hypothetical protein
MYERTIEGAFPLTPGEFKAFAKVDTDAGDAVVSAIASHVVHAAESYLGRELRANTWTSTFTNFPECIRLNKRKLDAVTQIEYDNDAAGQTIVSASDYYLAKDGLGGTVFLEDGESWPTDLVDKVNQIRVTFTTLPMQDMDEIKLGMLIHFAHLHEHRGDSELMTPVSSLDEATRAVARMSMRTSGAAEIYDRKRVLGV